MASQHPSPDSDAKLDMSSLVDISFLLLIYFLVTSTLLPEERDLALTMPGDPTDVPSPTLVTEPAEIRLTDEGHIYLWDELVSDSSSSRELPMLVERLKTLSEIGTITGTETHVTVKAADQANGQRFIDVINALSHDDLEIASVTLNGFR